MAIETLREIFEVHIPTKLKHNPKLAERLNCVYKFVVTGEPSGIWVVDLKTPGGSITEGDRNADCTITVGADALLNMFRDRIPPQVHFLGGRLKVSGDIGLVNRIVALF